MLLVGYRGNFLRRIMNMKKTVFVLEGIYYILNKLSKLYGVDEEICSIFYSY